MPHDFAAKKMGLCFWAPLASLAYLWVLFFAQCAHSWSVLEDYQYGWAAPVLFSWFLCQRWRKRPVPLPPPNASARLAVAVCLATAVLICPVRVVLEANPDWRPLLWVLGFAVIGFSLATAYDFGGWPYVRHFAFPALFPLSAVPWPGHVEIPVVLTFMKIGAAVAAEVLNACGIVALQHGNVLQTTNGYIGVDEACSGIKSFQTMVLIGLALSEFSGVRGLRRFRLVALGWLLAFAANWIRITVLAWIAALYGAHALEACHDAVGTAAFAITGCLLVLWGLRPKPAAPRPGDPAPAQAAWQRVAAARGAFALCLGCFLTAELLTFWWYHRGDAAGTAAERRAPWGVAWSVLGDSARPVEVSRRVMDGLRCDAGSAFTWHTGDGHLWMGYSFEWRPGIRAAFARSVHSPELCLPASGRTLEADLGYRRFESGEVRFLVKHLVFADRGASLNVFFVVEGSGVLSADEVVTAASAAGRLRTVLRHSNGADRHSLELIATGYDDPVSAWDQATGLLQKLVVRSSLATTPETGHLAGTGSVIHP
ncbi:MAG: exosortase/archaeosortase family protein [Verrucomicrobia bacterium]|nr:exosortase/archaeosortase family protein [Verrucomicrobiota bacterium]